MLGKLRAKRDVAAGKAVSRRAFKSHDRMPQKITLSGYQVSHRAAREIPGEHQRGADQNSILEIVEQFDRAGPSVDQTSIMSHARSEALS